MSAEPFEVDREGDFRAEIIEYGLQEKDSGSVGVRMKFRLNEIWNPATEQWEDWREYNAFAWGSQWIVKTDGSIHKPAVNSLVNNTGWDGNLASFVKNTWQPIPCQVSTKKNEYNGTVSFQVSFINSFDRVPGVNVGNVDEDKLKKLEAKFGSPLRALVGNAKRNTAPPDAVNGKGGPKPPPRRELAPESSGATTATLPPPPDEIPF